MKQIHHFTMRTSKFAGLLLTLATVSVSSSSRLHRSSSIVRPLQSSSISSIKRGGAIDSEADSDSVSDTFSETDTDTDTATDTDADSDSDADATSSTPLPTPTKTNTNSSPVKIKLSTNLNSPLDQKLQLTMTRSKTISDLRSLVSRTMKGKPVPLHFVRIQHHPSSDSLLPDETVLSTLISQVDSDSDSDSDDSDDTDSDADDFDSLHLTLDMIPPVEAKFALDFKTFTSRLTISELMSAYSTNQACLLKVGSDATQINDDEDSHSNTNISPSIKQSATIIQNQMRSSLDPKYLQRIDAEPPVTEEELNSLSTLLNFDDTTNNSARSKLKSNIQKNLNVDWGDTTRNFLLFLFFGYFGTADELCRQALMLMAPMCFVIQYRPVKVGIKQLFYDRCAGMSEFVLTMLPVTTQTILKMTRAEAVEASLVDIYGADLLTEGGLDGGDGEGESESESENGDS